MDESFQNYCIVCDRLIAPPPPGPEDKKSLNAGGKKRAAPAGAIRIKNPDGTTTTRTANGVKTTRPTLRPVPRLANPAVGAKLAKVVPKAPAPSATQPPPLTTSPSSSGSGNNVPSASPKIDAIKVVTPPPPEPFVSSIYCTRECADKDAGSSSANATDLSRALGVGFTYSDALVAAGLHVSPSAAPPSPLLGSDTDSSNGVRGVARTPDAFGSMPKTLDFFRLARDSPDDAWRESRTLRPQVDVSVQQQMMRQRSSGPRSASGTSSDSLASLWNGDQDNNSRRSSSNVGSLCAMTPMHTLTPDSMASARRSMSSSSDGSGIQRAALTRSALSHTSLGGLSSPALCAAQQEVGSAPSHTAYLMQAYASGFPARDGGAMSPPLLAGSATPDSRSTSVSIAPVPQRSTSGTIRCMRTRQGSTGATWDSFGKAEIRDRARRNTGCSENGFVVGSLPQSPDPERRGRQNSYCEVTPKQSFEIEHGGWQIRYMTPDQQRRAASRSRSRSRDPSSRYGTLSPVPAASTALPLPIPVRARPGPSALASSSSTARSRTPQTGGTPVPSRGASTVGFSPNGSRYGSSAALPDIAGLQIGAPSNSLSLAAASLSNGTATGPTSSTTSPYSASPRLSGSIPRPGFDWEKRTEHRTYELPKGVVQNPNKGLFYFNI
ncbi:hypothetical protein CcaverHIS002_0305350 [Cutaneotrichosporon cavernicola]|uniref:Uncharacterized protein n=1 Tax=Cutaneotrichosporon cavernicola TaxID=279322 RepID=A0AA48I711_9TREE|nr:uncharacterized protein CcaverHIS019_0305320 [Cutaneotrichosporon cavernicola]BEI82667.1 hypothetical protein CcaverHIS002_0305350 [Cutaneotrichosporon cavernicola]BEI90462.1 hypothetical protein CcaverHIS019_0305320 [Cutaneotrichosporon cavernicola]BEI98236.1 hypothetical protein CcaverHIS631_0305350 [Cutaneotrichosporon cavernicola]BEJ06012.1 hypothetical protein CcaverHIS641_0305340 [Cutaneotrichosporon cavernicola]